MSHQLKFRMDYFVAVQQRLRIAGWTKSQNSLV